MRPDKRLGQHFLRDSEIATRIVQGAGIESGDHVLEIGAGEGVLTDLLVESQAGRIVAVELDRRLMVFLEARLSHLERVELLQRDILRVDLEVLALSGQPFRVLGNLPYYITSPILFNLLDQRRWINGLTVMVQKEVGDRLVSPPGSRIYGIPSVLFQAYSRVERLFNVPSDAFYPEPQVDSTVLKFTFYDPPRYAIADEDLFRRLVKTAFGQRRKMMRNTISEIIHETDGNETLPVDLSRRPESLSVEEFVALSNALSA